MSDCRKIHPVSPLSVTFQHFPASNSLIGTRLVQRLAFPCGRKWNTHTCKIYIYLWLNSQYSSSRVCRFLFKGEVRRKCSWTYYKYSNTHIADNSRPGKVSFKREVSAGKYGWSLNSGPSLSHEVSSVSASWLPVTAELLLGRFLIPHVWHYKT